MLFPHGVFASSLTATHMVAFSSLAGEKSCSFGAFREELGHLCLWHLGIHYSPNFSILCRSTALDARGTLSKLLWWLLWELGCCVELGCVYAPLRLLGMAGTRATDRILLFRDPGCFFPSQDQINCCVFFLSFYIQIYLSVCQWLCCFFFCSKRDWPCFNYGLDHICTVWIFWHPLGILYKRLPWENSCGPGRRRAGLCFVLLLGKLLKGLARCWSRCIASWTPRNSR